MNSKLLIAALSFFLYSGLAAQVNAYKNARQAKRYPASFQRIQPEDASPSSPVAIEFLDTIYRNTFSNPADFTLDPSSGNNGYWRIGLRSQVGMGAFGNNVTFNSSTSSDGYAIFDSEGFGQGAQNNANMTVGPINIPNVANDVTLNFEQWYLRFEDIASVWISTNGTNYTLVGDNNDINTNKQTSNPHLKTIVISQYRGENIYIRFNFSGRWDYTWLVDDITITEATLLPDLAVTRVDNDDLFSRWHSYAQVPLTQVDTIGFTAFVKNTGYFQNSFRLSYVLKSGSTIIEEDTLPGQYTLAPGESDTIGYQTGYLPVQTGHYKVEVRVNMVAAEDAVAANDTFSVNKEITTAIYSPVSDQEPVYLVDNRSGDGGPSSPAVYNSYYVGQVFYIKNTQTVYGINALLGAWRSFSGFQDFELVLYEMDEVTGRPKEHFLSGDAAVSYRMSGTDNPRWRTFLFPRGVELEGGKRYLASINYYDTDKIFWFFGLEDEDADYGTWLYGPYGTGGAVNWWTAWEFSPCIQLNFNNTIGITSLENPAKLSVYPVPANNQLHVRLQPDALSPFVLRMTDLNGRVVFEQSHDAQTGFYAETISLDRIADGLYTFQVISGQGISTKKVLIAR